MKMRHLKFSLLILTAILSTGLPARAQDQSQGQSSAPVQTSQSSPGSVDLIGVGASIINNLINPPTRSAEISADAEVKKAKIAAEAEIAKEKLRIEASKSTDRVTPVLNQWGVTRVACAPGLAFVNGITTDTVCIQPSNSMPAGYYTYDSAKQQLLRTSGGGSQNASNNKPQTPTNTAQTPTDRNAGGVRTQNSVETSTTQNGQTVRNVQNTRISSPSGGRSGGGF